MNFAGVLQGTIGSGHQDVPPTVGPRVSRRAAISGISSAIAAGALPACSTGSAPEPVSTAARQADAGLGDLRDGASELVVAGERLNAGLLRRFYARHGFAPVWATRDATADSLTAAVLRAGEHGMDPELFHASILRRGSELQPLDRELLLSDALLSYADSLAHGAIRVERRRPAEALVAEPMDVTAALDAAIDGRDPVALIEALAPTTRTYAALRRALQDHRANAAADDGAARSRLRAIEVNLERLRWLPRQLPADRVWVNVADQTVTLYRADQPVFTSRVVVGREADRDQSPEFRAMIEGAFFNPPWVVPREIVEADLLPRIRLDPEYLAKNNMVMRDDGEVEQRPGPTAGLGYIMLDMPNRFDVYLHDTPARHVFGRDDRRLSYGCIRVENPREFTALLMQQSVEAIDQAIEPGVTTRRDLPRPVPVIVVYQTAFVGADGTPQFRPDFYDRDGRIWQGMQRRPSGAPSGPGVVTGPTARANQPARVNGGSRASVPVRPRPARTR